MSNDAVKTESLGEEADRTIQEARMVLPGIQALFGFQLIAVFNQRFDTALSGSQQRLHLAAMVLVALSTALIMTPAAYQRQAERGIVTRYFVDMASRLLSWAMLPLLVGISIETYLIAAMILHSTPASLLVAGVLALVIAGLWFVFPNVHGRSGRGSA